MRKSDKCKKVLGVVVILAIIVSVFGAVSAEDVSEDFTGSVADAKIQAAFAEDKIQSLSSQTEIFVGQGFDKCEIPTLSQMQNWITNSPYGAVNLYIGGSCRSCSNSALTASYVSQLSQQGWKFIPTWVGPQSACWGGSCGSRISNDPATAYNQGISEANAAINVAIDLGLASADGSGTIIYYDLEVYDTTNTACRNAAKSFISGWTAQLHARGSEAGVYGSSCGSEISDFATISNIPDAVWAAHWLTPYQYRPDATVWDVACLSNSLWANHQRIRQYAGGHDETWGGITLNIDCNVIDGIVASVASVGPADIIPLTGDMYGNGKDITGFYNANTAEFTFGVDAVRYSLMADKTSVGNGMVYGSDKLLVSNGFDYPVGETGYATQANDGDGWYNAQDFGVPNSGFGNKLHLGEDWNGEGGGDTDCGEPVYAVSKGTIVYAQNAGSGWGNVIIVRHQLPDGTQVTSQYGHLQSMSKTIGTVVERREQIGTIGKDGWPSCHLHFEIRLSNCPNFESPGPGYSYDTTGWTDPSDFIDSHRQLGSTIPIFGDMYKSGTDTTGIYNTGTAEFTFDGKTVNFGQTNDEPIIGDWDGDGYDEIGLFRSSTSMFYLVTRNWATLPYDVGAADKDIPFSYPEDIPIAGDWDGDGDDDIGGYYPGTFYLYLLNLGSSTATSYVDVPFGLADDIPLIGDWDNDGDDDVAVCRKYDQNNNPTYYFDLDHTGGQHELGPYEWGDNDDIPIAGRWNAGSGDKIGVYRPSTEEFIRNYDIPEIQECDGTDTSCGIYPNCENCNNYDGWYCNGNIREYRDYYCSGTSCTYTVTSSENCDNNDGWVDTGNTKWVPDPGNDCREKERKEQEYRDYACSNGACTYSVTDTQWLDTGNTRNKPDGTDCGSDAWVDTGNTQWVEVNECKDKEQKEQEYRDYYCSGGACTYSVTDTQWVDTGNTRNKPDGTICDCTASNTLKRCDGGVCKDTGICDSSICDADAACDGKRPGDSCGGGICNSVCECGVQAVGEDIAVFRNGWWALKYGPVNLIPDFAPADKWLAYGTGGWTPVAGDYNNDGTGDIAIFQNGWWALKYGPVNAIADCQPADKWLAYGVAGWTPVVGDYNNDGIDDIAIFQDGWWALKYGPVNAIPDFQGADKWLAYGTAGWTPVVGDYNNDGIDDIAIFQNGWWALKYGPVNAIADCQPADKWLAYGVAGWTPVVGDYNNDGIEDIAIFQNGWWALKYGPVNAIADCQPADKWLAYGIAGWTPVVGDFG